MCIFCKIASGEVKSEKILEDENFVAFKDINPQAPFHILIIPKKHITELSDLEGDIFKFTEKAAEKIGLKNKEKGFRLVLNYGKDSGQEIEHLHIHLLGGRKLKWPPG